MPNYIRFSLTQIEYVLALLKEGHFAKAAKACHVSQPTLSMQIQKLEEDLGIIIFDRSKKPIWVTSHGSVLIEQFQKIYNEAKKINSLLDSITKKPLTGLLTLGVIPTVAPYLLPRLLPVLELRYPSIKLRIVELQTHQILEALDEDTLDVGLLATPLLLPKIIEYPLYYEPFYILCKKNHELSQQKKIKYGDLKQNDIWLLEEGHCLRDQALDICSIRENIKEKRQFEFESGSLETLKNLVQTYGGYTLLPALSIAPTIKNTQLISFERPIPSRQIGLVYRREHYKFEMIEALGEAIIASLPEDIQSLRERDLKVLPIK